MWFNRLLYLFALGIPNFTQAQFQVRDSVLFNPHVTFGFGYHTPGGDLAARFGNNLSASMGFEIKTKTNWYYGIKGIYHFGTEVKEKGLMQNLFTEGGEILDNDGKISIVSPQERGYQIMAEFGKLLNWIGPNKNSGVLFIAGVGFFEHKIRLEHQENEIAQLEDEYLKGYDRLTNGLAISQFAGYYHMSNNRLINYFVGIEATEGFTKARRDFNFDTQTSDKASRVDVLLGVRVGWILNLYRREPDMHYFD